MVLHPGVVRGGIRTRRSEVLTLFIFQQQIQWVKTIKRCRRCRLFLLLTDTHEVTNTVKYGVFGNKGRNRCELHSHSEKATPVRPPSRGKSTLFVKSFNSDLSLKELNYLEHLVFGCRL